MRSRQVKADPHATVTRIRRILDRENYDDIDRITMIKLLIDEFGEQREEVVTSMIQGDFDGWKYFEEDQD